MDGSSDDGNYLVRVRAQVMTRDDSTGGWVPMGAGGLSNVSVCKTSSPLPADDETKTDYLIYGKRIADQTVVLSCPIKKDFHYYKVMPTFHHWRTGDKKFGLTFQTAADARAFDKGVRIAIEDLLDGTGDVPFITDLGDDDVFMTLDLPIDSRSSSTSSTFSGSAGSVKPGLGNPSIHSDLGSSPYSHPHANHHHLPCMTFSRPYRLPSSLGNPANNNFANCPAYPPVPKSKGEDIWKKETTVASRDNSRRENYLDIEKIDVSGELNSYVQLSRDKTPRSEHEYSYPMVESYKSGNCDILSLKKPQPFNTFSCQPAPRLPMKGKKKKGWRRSNRNPNASARVQCQHCLETFSEASNCRGSCKYAPDRVLNCINATTCISCAQCMEYHCMADNEGEFNQHPCSCDNSDNHCPKRWCALALLSLFVPCLWCYLPLRACHKCGMKCGICGGRHEPA